MNKVYVWIKSAALSALTIFIGLACWLVWDVKKWVDFEQTRINSLVSESTLTTKAVRKTAEDERRFLNSQQPKIAQAVSNFNNLLVAARGTMNATTGTILNIQPVLQAAQNDLSGLHPTLQHLDDASLGVSKIANDPEIPATLKAMHKTLDGTASVAAHADHVSAKVEKLADHYIDPLIAPKRWYQKVRDDAKIAAQFAIKWLLK